MSTIEEAWAALDEAIGDAIGAAAFMGDNLADEVETAARNLALAVLEEAVMKVTHDNDMGAFECPDCGWGIQHLRARIAALGKEEA